MSRELLRIFDDRNHISHEVLRLKVKTHRAFPTPVHSNQKVVFHKIRTHSRQKSSQEISYGWKPAYAGTVAMIRSTRDRDDQNGCARLPLAVIGAGKPPSSRTVQTTRISATSR